MGFVDKLRAELVDVIEWIDDSRRTLVWRFPRYHNQIKNGAQLIVRPGQTAVFVHQGRIADVFVRTPEAVVDTWRRVFERVERENGDRGGVVLLHDIHPWSVDRSGRLAVSST